MNELTERERQVIEWRFETVPGKTLDECATLLDCTRERVRQIEAQALRKLRDA